MAAAIDIDTTELQLCIKGLLISRPTVIRANTLQRECENELGKQFPFRQLGFLTFVDYLRSIPSVVMLEPHNSANPDVYPIASRASRHIDQLVSKQRITAKRKTSSRRGGFNGRPPSRRRTLNTRPSLLPTPTVSFNKETNNRDFGSNNRYDERHLTRNGTLNADGLHTQTDGHGDTKVYPKTKVRPENVNQCSGTNGIPAGSEDDDFDNEDFCDYGELENDSEEEMSKETIQLWSRVLKVENNNSSKSRLLEGREERLHQTGQVVNDDTNISEAMIKNFQNIMSKYPDGIWASQLQQIYFEQFHVGLDFLELGYPSAITLVSSLPSVFTFQRAGPHDWKLYDARYVKPENLVSQENEEDNLRSDYIDNERYIPKTIIEKITKLLQEYPNGFRSTDLLHLYRDTFNKPLDLKNLGFKTLEEFLPVLKNDITLKKTTDYYLLLPKHRTVPYEAVEPSKPDEHLKVYESPSMFPVPKGVLRPGDKVPLQELPPLLLDVDPTKPLLEMAVRVAEVISPTLFYMILDSKYLELENMMDDLHKFYTWEEDKYHILLPHVQLNLVCAHKYNGYWHRVKIMGIKNNNEVEVEYIDYGTIQKVKSSELRYLSTEFANLPAQAICAKLIGVKPCNGTMKFPIEVCNKFLDLVTEKRLIAHVYQVSSRGMNEKERMHLELFLYDVTGPKEIVLNDYLLENGLAMPSHQLSQAEDVPTSVEELSAEDKFTAPSPINPSTSLNPPEEKKRPIRPPPGFEGILTNPDFELSAPVPNAPPSYSSTVRSQSSSYLTAEQQNVILNNCYMMSRDPKVAPKVSQHQGFIYWPHNVSNMPLFSMLLPSDQNSIPPTSVMFNTLVPPLSPYHPHSNNYRPQNCSPHSIPPHNDYYRFFQTPVSQDLNMTVRPQVPGYSCDLSSLQTTSAQPVKVSPPSTCFLNYTPITVPECSPKTGLPKVHTASSSTHVPTNSVLGPIQHSPSSTAHSVKSLLPESNLIPRPCTPLTPASAEVANICKKSKTTNNSTSELPNLRNSLDTFISNSQNIKSSLDNSVCSSSPFFDKNIDHYPKMEEPSEIEVKTTPLAASTEELHSEFTSPSVELQFPTSQTEENSGNGYVSASENIDEVKQELSNLVLTEQYLVPSSRFPCENKLNEAIPDSWEDIDPDDTPAKASNYAIDFKQPLDLIIKNELESTLTTNVPDVAKSAELKINSQFSPTLKIQTPINWKDSFDPDAINSLKGKENIQKGECSPVKFNLKKIPVQKFEIQGKFFHLLCVNNEPAVVAFEFFKQFLPSSMQPRVALRILESREKAPCTISKRDNPAILAEFDKITEFCGGLLKKDVIRVNKIMILYISEISECLNLLQIQNKPLLNDLKKISDEFQSC